MDDLGLFWPRWLGDALTPQRVEVVNQGVGGWNSFHVRVYVESQIDRLAPEILVLYLGHNDIYTRTPAPYRALFAAWQAGRGGPPPAAARARRALESLRLYVGLRHVLIAARERRSTIAVPVAHARDNFAALAALMAARGGRMLLVSEGVQPDATPLAEYRSMMAGLAEGAPHVAYLDAAGRFDAGGFSDDFLDANHLSVSGHQRLAGWVAEALGAEGWVAPAAAGMAPR
jgi:lysophospholipase L1-like esterase